MAMDNSQLPGGGLPPVSGIGPFKVRFEADTAALQSGVDTAISGIRDELTSLKSGFMDFETSLGSSLSMTIGRLRGELASMVSELRNAAQEFRTMGYSGGGSPGGSASSSFYIPPVGGHGFSGSTGSAGNTGNVGGSPGGNATGPTVGPPPPPHSTGYTPTPGTYAQQLQQFRFDQINPGSGVFLHEMGTASQIQNIDRQNKHLYESTSGSLQQHLAQVQAGGKTTYLESAIQQEIATLQQTSSAFSSEFAKKYGSSTPTGKTIQSILNDPAAMDSLFGQSLRPSDIQAEVLKRSPELANNPGLLQEEILAERQTRQRTISQTNQNMIQAQYLLESGATSSSMATAAQETLKTAPNATQATASSSRMRRTLGEAAIVYLAGEALGSAGGVLGGPYAQFGSGSFYGNAWQTAMPYDISTGAMGLNAGVNPNTTIGTYQALGHQQHLSSLEISKTAAIESNFAGVRGAAFLFKDSADTYQFATFMGISGSLAGQVAGQAIGGGSTQAPGALFSSIQKAGQLTGLSNTTVANLVSTMQNALSSSYQSTQEAPGYTAGMASFFKNGMGMTNTETTNAVSQYAGMMGNGPHTNLISGQVLMKAYASTHGGAVGSLPEMMNNAAAGLTPAEFQAVIPMLKQYASQGQMQFQLAQQGILSPNLFGGNVQKEYQAFSTQSSSQLLSTYIKGLDTQKKTPPKDKPTKPPTGEYQKVLSETAKVQNAQLAIGNATISVSHRMGPEGGAAAGIGSSLLKDAGVALAVAAGSGLAGGIKNLINRFRGGGGGGGTGPLGGGGGSGGGGLGGGIGGTCTPCEQGLQNGVSAVASGTEKIVGLLGAGAAVGVGATMLMDKSGKWIPNPLSASGQSAMASQNLNTTLGSLNTTITNLNSTLAKMNGGTSPGGTLSSWTGGTYNLKANPNIAKWLPQIKSASSLTGVPTSILEGVMSQESGGTNGLTSPTGAEGLMQLEPGTAASLGVSNPWNPQQNLNGGAKYLAQMDKEFGTWQLALAAYNAGPGEVSKLIHSHGKSFADIQKYLPAQTQNYVNSISAMLQKGGSGSPSLAGSLSSSLPVQSQLSALLSGQLKAPKTSHPDTPRMGSGTSTASLRRQLDITIVGGALGAVAGGGSTALEILAALAAL